MEYLQESGIATRPGTHAVHTLKYYSGKYKLKPEDFPNAYIADRCSIAFPLFPDMKQEEIEYIFSKISNYKISK
jgi:dTDP-4-amino-4,6-dideoxygalactose transaminase